MTRWQMHSLWRGRSTAAGERGQSLVEFALMAPVLLLLVLGAVDYGRVYYQDVQVIHAARNGAAYASINPPSSNQTGNFQQQLEDAAFTDTNLAASGATVTGSQGTDASGGQYVEITVQQPFRTLVAWPGLPHQFTLRHMVDAKVLQ